MKKNEPYLFCEMVIGGDDTGNDVITLDTCFSMIVYVHARFRFALIGRNLTAQSTRSHKDVVASSPTFSRPAARAPRRACKQVLIENSFQRVRAFQIDLDSGRVNVF